MLPALAYPTLRIFLDGMLLMMALYAFATYAWHRKRIYAWYGLYLLGMIANLYFNDEAHRLTDQHAAGTAVALASWLEVTIQSVAFVFYIQFARTLLNLRQRDPFSLQLSNYMLVVLGVGLLTDTLLLWVEPVNRLGDWAYTLSDLNRYAMAALTFTIVPRILRLRNLVSSIFIIGTAFFVGGAILAVTMNLTGWGERVIEQPFSFPLIPMQLGIVIESLLFTVAISVVNRQIEREKICYQAQLIEQLQENERKQAKLNGLRDEIARDLHDEMGSQLSSISILSQTTARYVTDHRAQQRLATIGQTTRQVMDSMREIVWSLNSSSDSLQNIGLRIQETAYTLFNDSAIRPYINLAETTTLHGLTEKQRRELHLIAKECLTNVLRHASAKHVGIQLKSKDDLLVLSIHDDGIGFEPDTSNSGLGLSSIRQRAERLNAELCIESEFGEGTTVTLTCPLTVEKSRTGLLPETIPA